MLQLCTVCYFTWFGGQSSTASCSGPLALHSSWVSVPNRLLPSSVHWHWRTEYYLGLQCSTVCYFSWLGWLRPMASLGFGGNSGLLTCHILVLPVLLNSLLLHAVSVVLTDAAKRLSHLEQWRQIISWALAQSLIE